MKKYVYHYKARFEYRLNYNIIFANKDGLYETLRGIINETEFLRFRHILWEKIKAEGIDPIFKEDDMQINSLTFLHEVEE